MSENDKKIFLLAFKCKSTEKQVKIHKKGCLNKSNGKNFDVNYRITKFTMNVTDKSDFGRGLVFLH